MLVQAWDKGVRMLPLSFQPLRSHHVDLQCLLSCQSSFNR